MRKQKKENERREEKEEGIEVVEKEGEGTKEEAEL